MLRIVTERIESISSESPTHIRLAATQIHKGNGTRGREYTGGTGAVARILLVGRNQAGSFLGDEAKASGSCFALQRCQFFERGGSVA